MFLHKSSGICNLLFDQIPDFFKKTSGLNNIFLFFHTFSTFAPLLGLSGARSILVCASMLQLWLPLVPRLALSRPKLSPSWLNLVASCFNLAASWCNLVPSLLNLVPPRPDLAPHWLKLKASSPNLAPSWRNLMHMRLRLAPSRPDLGSPALPFNAALSHFKNWRRFVA